MFTAKIMYCLWVTLAEKDDNFVIETTKPLPKKYKKMSRKEQMTFIKERILGRSNEELSQVNERTNISYVGIPLEVRVRSAQKDKIPLCCKLLPDCFKYLISKKIISNYIRSIKQLLKY